MDGNLDDPAWQAAAVLTDFHVIRGRNQGQISDNITAKVMRDDAWLFLGFDVRHPQPATIVPKAVQRDSNSIRVQRENCVKVTFDPGTSGKLWYHIRLSAGNVISDQRNLNESIDMGWDCPLRSAAHITETGWQAELGIPFAVVMEMGDPVKARMNLLAHVFEPVLDPYGVEINQECTVYSWAPVGSDWWRMPELFGRVTGLADAVFKAPFLPLLESAQVSAYRAEGKKYFYDVAMAARNSSSRDGRVIIRVRDEPAGAGGVTTNLALELPGNASKEITVAVPVNSVRQRSIRVEMLSEQSGELLSRLLIENPPALDLFKAYMDKNYYTTEDVAYLICETGLPEKGLAGSMLQVAGKDGRVWGESPAAQSLTQVPVPLNNVPVGRHGLTVTHRQADGGLISEQQLELIKRVPKPGREWKIDRINRMVLHDGRPQFIYGILMGGWNPGVYNEENFSEIAAAGFNAIMYWAAKDNSPTGTLHALDMAARHNLRMCVTVDGFSETPDFVPTNLPAGLHFRGFTGLKGKVIKMPGRAERSRIFAEVYRQAEPLIRQGIETVKDHPALMAYEGFDEPMAEHWFDQYVQGRELYKLIHETDGYHPVRVLWGFPPPDPKYTDWTDILAIDPYWAPPVTTFRNSPNYAAGQTALLTMRGEKERKPVWITPILEMYSGHYKRPHLPAEQKAQSWLAIIHQASGLFYFVYPSQHQVMWDMMKTIGSELRALNPALTTPLPAQRITYAPAGFDPGREIMPDVQALLRRNPSGGYVLLAANSQPWPVTAVFTVHLPGLHSPVKRMFGGGSLALENGAFQEKLDPYATRAYLLSAPESGKPVDIVVAAQAHLDAWQPESATPRTGRPGKRNIMPNPSFEEASLPDYPDYWWLGSHCGATHPDERTGRVNAQFSLDKNNPYHGKVSYRVASGYVYFELSPQHDRPTPYVWSAWMRADSDEALVKIDFMDVDNKKTLLKITREWKRYRVPVIMPANAPRHNGYGLSVINGPVWIDAVQFEQGAEPTEFEP